VRRFPTSDERHSFGFFSKKELPLWPNDISETL